MDRPDVAEERLIYDEASYDYVEDLDWLKPAATTKPIAPPKIAMPSKENTQRNTELMNNPDVETHYMLFENQGALDDKDIVQYAATLGLDASRMIREVLAGRHTARAREDFRSGARGGVNGTPTLFINGVRYEGATDCCSLQSLSLIRDIP